MLNDEQHRIVAEKAELDARIGLLVRQMKNQPTTFYARPEAERMRIYSQHRAMVTYSTILGERIAAFPPPPTENP